MAAEENPIRIIGNESNTVHEIETGETNRKGETTAEKQKAADEQESYRPYGVSDQSTNELATNDGAVLETLDTAFHNKPGVTEGENLSGSDRADYYESRPDGRSDAEEEQEAGKH